MTKKENELLDMMKKFKKLNPKEQGFICGLAEGILICKTDSIMDDYDGCNQFVPQTS